jgi:hypothetical protein
MKYWVCKPGGNDAFAKASRAAMSTFATAIVVDDPELAGALREWIRIEEELAAGNNPPAPPQVVEPLPDRPYGPA